MADDEHSDRSQHPHRLHRGQPDRAVSDDDDRASRVDAGRAGGVMGGRDGAGQGQGGRRVGTQLGWDLEQRRVGLRDADELAVGAVVTGLAPYPTVHA